MRARVCDLGSSAILAFDGDRHVGQLQFRRYAAGTRAPNGLWNPLYWGDVGSATPSLPIETSASICSHVGQLGDTDARDVTYQERGIGLQLLDHFLDWAMGHGFGAVAAKATPSVRSVMRFMAGLPAEAYAERGFEVAASYVDVQLHNVVRERKLTDAGADAAARVSCGVKRR